MKMLLFIICIAFDFSAQAQSTTPTKEQTIQFIIGTLSKFENSYSLGSANHTDGISNMVIKGDSVIVSKYHNYSSGKDHSELTFDYAFDLKQIEAILPVISQVDDSYIYKIRFDSYNKSNGITEKQSWLYPKYEGKTQKIATLSLPAPDNEQLIKAFNHLRKLCGAPEPLKFD